MDCNNELVLLLIIVNIFNCHSISIEAMGKAVVGKEFTIKCMDRSRKVIWYKDKSAIGWSKDTFTNNVHDNLAGCHFENISYKRIYEFKRCGVKHELTIKSIDYKRDNGVKWSCQSSRGGIRSTLTMLVIDKPTVTIEKHNGYLLCIAEGPYRKTNFLPWKHSIDNKLVREIEGYYINTTVYSLNITNNQNDEGSYICTVNNGIPDPVTKQLDQMISYQLNLHVKPALYSIGSSSKLSVGQNGSFSFEYLQDKSVTVSWNRDGQKLENNSRVTMSEEPTEINHPYNNNIKLSGIKTTLTITSIIITDQGNYICDICNQYGCSGKTFQLDLASLEEESMKANAVHNLNTVIGTSVGVAAAFICVILFTIFFTKRRVKPNGSPVPIITDNDLYISSDPNIQQPHPYGKKSIQNEGSPILIITDNDLYVSSDLYSQKPNSFNKDPAAKPVSYSSLQSR